MLKAQPRAFLLRGGLVAARGILHRVALVENDYPIEVGAQPFDDLMDARNLLSTLVGA